MIGDDRKENHNIDPLIRALRKPERPDEATPHMAAENVLAREKANPNGGSTTLAELIAGWELQEF